MGPSFFKILIKDIPLRLRIPPAFLEHFPAKDFPEMTVIRTAGKERYWHVGLQLIEDGYYFSHGWSELVKDLGLSLGDFLLFRLVGASMFEIVPYDKTCCEKPLNFETHQPPKHKKTKRSSIYGAHEPLPLDMIGASTDPSAAEPKEPYFVVKLKRHNRYALSMPMKFVVDTGLLEQESAVLVNPEGRVWPVQIVARKRKPSRRVHRVDLGRGWREFRVGNRLADGGYCTLSFTGGEDNKLQLHSSTM